MHPNIYLKTFWEMNYLPHVFVAMEFSPKFNRRFEEVYRPAIEKIETDGIRLTPHRVDASHSGDSIVSEIMKGVSSSHLILADVSTVFRSGWWWRRNPFRNANVMYEVGLALACRQPSDVLLVKDDQDKFLFDVSTIPHVSIRGMSSSTARQAVYDALVGRLAERNLLEHAKVQIALSSLSGQEIAVLRAVPKFDDKCQWTTVTDTNAIDFVGSVAYPRLLDKQIVRTNGRTPDGRVLYSLTRLGVVVASKVNFDMKTVEVSQVPRVNMVGDILPKLPGAPPPFNAGAHG